MTIAAFNTVIQDAAGNALTGAVLTVRLESDNSLATIYSDIGGTTPITNPITTGTSGTVLFYAANAAYKLTAVHSTGTREWRHVQLGNAAGAGDMLAANNLSDVASPITAYNNLRTRGADIASATTVNLSTATGDLVDVTGTTAITAITLADGGERTVRFAGILTLTNGASLILPGGANITTAAGDFATFRGYATSIVRCVSYTRASGYAINDANSGGGSSASAPQGRLTLSTGVQVMTATVSGATTVYYTPCEGQLAPIYDGAAFVMVDTAGELSQATTDTTKSPAAVGTFGSATNVPALYDKFAWLDSATPRCTRGPGWLNSATVTMTIATPGVITWTAHGLREGNAVRFTTTGALPTGLAANTVYYVGRSPAANTFNLSTSIANAAAGTFIATTGSQSGTHTCYNSENVRGTGAGTTELELWKGFWVNKYDITNGPVARRGTYVGTIGCNASSTIDFIIGGTAAGGTAAVINVWNAYNRRDVGPMVRDSTSSWSYNSTTLRAMNNSLGQRISMVRGLKEDMVLTTLGLNFSGGASGDYQFGVALNSTNVDTHMVYGSFGTSNAPGAMTFTPDLGIGAHYLQAVERQATTASAASVFGVVSSRQAHSFTANMRY